MAVLPKDKGSGDGVSGRAERAKPLELPDCKGLPREMLESVRERRLLLRPQVSIILYHYARNYKDLLNIYMHKLMFLTLSDKMVVLVIRQETYPAGTTAVRIELLYS